MQIFKEFREFAVRGNVMDLAVGVIIGGAFGKIVTSIVNDIIMPPIAVLSGGINFQDLKYTLSAVGRDGAPVTLNYGAFIQNVVDFLIVALVVFTMVRAVNRMRRKQEAKTESPAPPEDIRLLAEIRDLLKK